MQHTNLRLNESLLIYEPHQSWIRYSAVKGITNTSVRNMRTKENGKNLLLLHFEIESTWKQALQQHNIRLYKSHALAILEQAIFAVLSIFYSSKSPLPSMWCCILLLVASFSVKKIELWRCMIFSNVFCIYNIRISYDQFITNI